MVQTEMTMMIHLAPARLDLAMVDRRNHLMVMMIRQLDLVMADRSNRLTATTRRRPAATTPSPRRAMVKNLPTAVEEFPTTFHQELVVAPADAMIMMTSHPVTLGALRATHTARIRLTVARLDRRNSAAPTTMISPLALVDLVEAEAKGILNVAVETRTRMDKTPLIPTVVSKADRAVATTITRLSLPKSYFLRNLYLAEHLFDRMYVVSLMNSMIFSNDSFVRKAFHQPFR